MRSSVPREGEAPRPKLVNGQIEASDVASRLLLPTSEQGPWLPYERFAETIATSRKIEGPHPHEAEELLVYVLEGFVDHAYDGKHETLSEGSIVVLTAHDEIRHELVMQKGRSARWLSIVLRIPWHTEKLPTAVVTRTVGDPIAGSDGTLQRPVVGPRARAEAFTGLECADIEFAKEGTSFLRIGRSRKGIAYALAGTGAIGEDRLEPGQGVLVERASGLAVRGTPGFRLLLATVPRPPE
jgi:redox-sensitive bicupin YhaK (pirin superfamily)